MDYSLPGSSVRGILQAEILEWVAISFSRGFSQPRDWTWVYCIDRWVLCQWVIWEALGPGVASISLAMGLTCPKALCMEAAVMLGEVSKVMQCDEGKDQAMVALEDSYALEFKPCARNGPWKHIHIICSSFLCLFLLQGRKWFHFKSKNEGN